MAILTWKHLDTPGLEIVRGDLPGAVAKDAEIGLRPAVARERDLLAVGRPLRLQIAVTVIRQLRELGAVGLNDVQIADAAEVTGKHETIAVGRPRRSGDSLEMRIDAADDLLLAHVEQVEDILAFPLRRERECPPIGREGALRVQQAELLEFGLVVLFTRRLMRFPVRASASQRSMKTSPRRKLPFERKTICSPLGESAGARKIAPPLRRSDSRGCANLRARSRSAICGRCLTCIASLHSSPRSSSDLPSSRRNARSTPTLGAAWRIAPMTSSPHRSPTYSQRA